MHVTPWVCTAVLALISVGCASNPDSSGKSGTAESAVSAPAVGRSADAKTGHLRVLVSYENGQFAVKQVTKVNAPLRQPRSGKTRRGLTYVANQTGKPAFLGSAPDPRSVHVETPNAVTGELEHEEVQPPGIQHFFVYVPEGTETVDFQEYLANAAASSGSGSGAGAQAPSTTRAPSGSLGRVDLRPHR